MDDITYLRKLIEDSSKIVAFTGAGISTESGIPDFRGPDGIWTKNPEAERLSNISNFAKDEEIRRGYWNQKLEGFASGAEPNEGHKALARLYPDKLMRVITQNIDGLHQASGVPDNTISELHGSMRYVECMGCGRQIPTDTFFADCQNLKLDPATAECFDCGKLFKPGVVMFGEMLPEKAWLYAERAAMSCSLMLVVGSSLTVYPAAGLVEVAQQMGASTVIINRDPTDYDRDATLVIREPIGEVLGQAIPEE